MEYMLTTVIPRFYKVRSGQTLRSVAEAFGLTECLLIAENALTEEIFEGQILRIPDARGNVYIARAGDTKRLLSGSEENYEKKNRTALLYPGMKVLL